MNSIDKADINLEFGHIYTNQEFGQDHLVGTQIARTMKEILTGYKATVTTNVWIDDYNPSLPYHHRESFANSYLDQLRLYGLYPDYFAFESDAVVAGQYLIESIPSQNHNPKKKGRKLYIRTPNGKVRVKDTIHGQIKYICPLLSAVYALAKLGAPLPVKPKPTSEDIQVPFAGERSITILPDYPFFLESEEGAKNLIGVSPYSDYLSLLYHFWFDPNNPPSEKDVKQFLYQYGLVR